MIQKLITMLALLVSGFLLEANGGVYRFDFEKGEGAKLPPGSRQVIGGAGKEQAMIVPDKGIAPYRKALRLFTKEKGVRILFSQKIPAGTGDVLEYQGKYKGKGRVKYGIYGYDQKGNMIHFYTTTSKPIDTGGKWVPHLMELQILKEKVVYVNVFIQCDSMTQQKAPILYAPFTVQIKGVNCGFLERKQNKEALYWKAPASSSGTLKAVRANKNAKNMFLSVTGREKASAIFSNDFAAEAGDTLFVKYQVKGKGILTPGIMVKGAKGESSFIPAEKKLLSPEWKEETSRIFIPNGKNFETEKALLQFVLSQNADSQIRNVHIRYEKGLYRGDTSFPQNAVIFPLLKNSFMPSVKELNSIPETLGGVKGQKITFNNSLTDLASYLKGVKEKKCAWIYYKIDSPMACNYTLGGFADWWMTVYCNGKKVIDTSRSGNLGSMYSVADQTAKVRLKKGANIIAVKFVCGMTSALFGMGGSNEIRKYLRAIEKAGALAKDDYNDFSRVRSGNPRYKKMVTIAGITSKTGVGIYERSGKVDPFRTPFSLDKKASWSHIGQSILLVELPGKKSESMWSYIFSAGKDQLKCSLTNKKGFLYFFVEENGKKVSPLIFIGRAERLLPMDHTLYTDKNGCIWAHFSSTKSAKANRKLLWDSPLLKKMVKGKFFLSSQVKAAKNEPVIVDDLEVATGNYKEEEKANPFLLDHADSFDPVKAGWKLIVEDDFSGNKIDLKKWTIDRPHGPYESLVTLNGKGQLTIKVDWDKDKKKLVSGRLWSNRAFRYGYYEARLKFTRIPGWWSSFFMISQLCANGFYGVEFDFYEDYHTRPVAKGAPYRDILDCSGASGHQRVYKHAQKSWNYHARVPSFDQFHTFGVKWTPFQVCYYLNGKRLPGFLKFSPYNTVTFDAFNHCTVSCDTRMVLAGEIGVSDAKLGKFPDYFVVDHFRAYAMPEEDNPTIKWTNDKKHNIFIKEGDKLTFEVDAKPSAKTRSPLRGVYLFDNGYFIAKKEKPPYTFTIPMTKEFYKTTQYLVPGISKGVTLNPPPFVGPFPHSFAVLVQDENGNGAMTSIKQYILQEQKETRPYKGKPQEIPGVLKLPYYDEGGQEVAYYWAEQPRKTFKFRPKELIAANEDFISHHHRACNYLKYTVDVKKAGKYDLTFRYANVCRPHTDSWMKLYMNGVEIAHFQTENGGRYSTPRQKTTVKNVYLPAGKQKFLVMLKLSGFVADVTFTPSK